MMTSDRRTAITAIHVAASDLAAAEAAGGREDKMDAADLQLVHAVESLIKLVEMETLAAHRAKVVTKLASGSNLDDDPHVVAEKHHLKIVLPYSSELFIDIDDAEAEAVLKAMLDILAANQIAFHVVKQTVSKSGNKHYYLLMERSLSDIERIALQACLGSDRKRELLSILRIFTNSRRPPTVFFETQTPRAPNF